MDKTLVSIDPFDCIVFGGTGDLALRKLLPALYHRDRDAQLPDSARIVAVSRTPMTSIEYRSLVEKSLQTYLAAAEFDLNILHRFIGRIEYVTVEALEDVGWADLVELVNDRKNRIRVFYLATAPDLFGPICRRLKAVDLINSDARVVLEKPIGRDLASARRINDEVGTVFAEPQIFRIDHYLGKETVQNLLALRFANSLFEPLWQNGAINHVQITVAETIGIENRGGYYDRAGALRDMVQNHLLQLLCLVAMEPPGDLDKEAVRDEKIKVLNALAPIMPDAVGMKTVRGQYRSGAIQGDPVRGYLEETGIAGDSATETFVAVKVEVRNWRWAGVPFYLRTGKRMPDKVSEIVIQFRPVPHWVFPPGSGEAVPNRLVIRLQPDEHIRLHMMAKEPGPVGVRLRPAALNLSFAEAFKRRFPDAYERLLMDVVRGTPTLFMRRDEVETAWRWTEQILQGWEINGDRPKPYTAGTWGPSASVAMIERDGRTWHDDPGGPS
jgi:glucose-6-phosphate 1-dehydrogenase